MSNVDIDFLNDRLDFIEFKQKLLFFKQPNHKAAEFANLSIMQFLDIKKFVYEFENYILDGNSVNLKDFEVSLFKVCPSVKTYPNAANLIAKILMNRENYDVLFSSNN